MVAFSPTLVIVEAETGIAEREEVEAQQYLSRYKKNKVFLNVTK